jgi:hypothetical protein
MTSIRTPIGFSARRGRDARPCGDVENVLGHGELITHVEIPLLQAGARSGYLKVRDRASYRGGSPRVAGYQDAINHWGTTINPDGCAPVRGEHSVDVIAQISICGRVRHLTDN